MRIAFRWLVSRDGNRQSVECSHPFVNAVVRIELDSIGSRPVIVADTVLVISPRIQSVCTPSGDPAADSRTPAGGGRVGGKRCLEKQATSS